MSNKGTKTLAGQVAHLRMESQNLKSMNARLNNEVRVLQSVQLSMMEPYFFKALLKWIKKWINYRQS